MKRTALTLCIGMIIGLLAGVSSGSLAAVGDKLEAAVSDFIFYVDGDVKILDADPIAINGTSYLPVRTIANLVGYDVTYKSDMKSIEFNTPVEGGGTVVTSFEMPVIEQIEGIDNKINKADMQITIWRGALEWEKTMVESPNQDRIDNFIKVISDYQDKITELKNEKSKLQAQI